MDVLFDLFARPQNKLLPESRCTNTISLSCNYVPLVETRTYDDRITRRIGPSRLFVACSIVTIYLHKYVPPTASNGPKPYSEPRHRCPTPVLLQGVASITADCTFIRQNRISPARRQSGCSTASNRVPSTDDDRRPACTRRQRWNLQGHRGRQPLASRI